MNTVRVLRVELCYSVLDSFGNLEVLQQGPYTTYEAHMSNKNGYKHHSVGDGGVDHQPDPEEDGLRLRWGMIFGFKDEIQMYAWFETDILGLNAAGFSVSEYEVLECDVHYGERQVMFKRESAGLRKITNIFDMARAVSKRPDFFEKLYEYYA